MNEIIIRDDPMSYRDCVNDKVTTMTAQSAMIWVPVELVNLNNKLDTLNKNIEELMKKEWENTTKIVNALNAIASAVKTLA